MFWCVILVFSRNIYDVMCVFLCYGSGVLGEEGRHMAEFLMWLDTYITSPGAVALGVVFGTGLMAAWLWGYAEGERNARR